MNSGVVFGRFRGEKTVLGLFPEFSPHPRLFPSTKQPVPAGCEWSGRYFVVDSPDRWFRPFRLDFGVVFGRFRTQKPVLELFPEFSPHPRLVFSEKQPGPVSFQRSGLVRVVDSSAGEIEHSEAGALFKTINFHKDLSISRSSLFLINFRLLEMLYQSNFRDDLRSQGVDSGGAGAYCGECGCFNRV